MTDQEPVNEAADGAMIVAFALSFIFVMTVWPWLWVNHIHERLGLPFGVSAFLYAVLAVIIVFGSLFLAMAIFDRPEKH